MNDYYPKAAAALFVITAYNALLGLLMIARFIPVMSGMALSFLGMGLLVGIAIMILMPGEKPWRKPSYKTRRDRALREAEESLEYWNNLIKEDN